jgi:acetolactate synthase-1/2/3 large subunit
LILVEAQPPVSFFAYPGKRSYLAPDDCRIHTLASEDQDGAAGLEALLEEFGFSDRITPLSATKPCLPGDVPLTPEAIAATVAALMPEGSVIADEMVSASERVWPYLACAAPHSHLPVTGGSIGQGLPVALGAALAYPERKVIALEADGSAMYTLQTLWTMAREKADVVVVVFANKRYQILDIEMRRTGSAGFGPRANDMIDLTRPDIDWVRLASGLGVQAALATTTSEFTDYFGTAIKQRGPQLIAALVK